MRTARSRSSERGSRVRAAPVPRSWNPVRAIYEMTFERDAKHFRAKTKDVGRKSLGSQELKANKWTNAGGSRSCSSRK